MRWLMLALLPLAACYGPTYRDCAIACGATGCPVGLTCVDGFCRAGGASLGSACVDAPPPPPGDGDGDTVSDDMDNCPMDKNTDQANEDGDEFGNVCDPCPPFPDEDNLDTDGDKVGDGCDPNLTIPGETIVFFDGFEAMPTTAMITGSWLFISGQARVSDSTVDGSASDVVWTLDVPANETVLAKVAEISNLAGPSAAAGIVSQLSATNGFSCVAGVDSGNNAKLMIRNRMNTIVDSSDATMGVTGKEILFNEHRIGQEYRCNAPAVTGTRAMYTSTMTPTTTAQFGLRAYDSTARYDWIMVIGRP